MEEPKEETPPAEKAAAAAETPPAAEEGAPAATEETPAPAAEGQEAILNPAEVEALRNESQANQIMMDDSEAEVSPYTLVEVDQHSGMAAYPGIGSLNRLFTFELRARLQKLLRRNLQVQALSPKILSVQQYMRMQQKPVALNLVKVTSHGNKYCVVKQTSSWLYCLISIMFGGTLRKDENTTRSLGKIEERMAWHTAEQIMSVLTATWQEVWTLKYQLEKTTVEPTLITVLNEEDKLAIFSYAIVVDEIRSEFEFCLDLSLLETLKTEGKESTAQISREEADWRQQIKDGVMESPVEIVAFLQDIPIKFAELINLKVGDAIPIEDPQKAWVKVEHVKTFVGRVAMRDGNHVIEITNLFRT